MTQSPENTGLYDLAELLTENVLSRRAMSIVEEYADLYFKAQLTYEKGLHLEVQGDRKGATASFEAAVKLRHSDAMCKLAPYYLFGFNTIPINWRYGIWLADEALNVCSPKGRDAASLMALCASYLPGPLRRPEAVRNLLEGDLALAPATQKATDSKSKEQSQSQTQTQAPTPQKQETPANQDPRGHLATQSPYAQLMYADCLRYGLFGLEPDPVRASDMHNKAWTAISKLANEQNDPQAQWTLGMALWRSDQPGSAALKYLQQAADQGHAAAQCFVASATVTIAGPADEKALQNASKLLEAARAQNFPGAGMNLGLTFERSVGVDNHLLKAKEAYSQVVKTGDASADAVKTTRTHLIDDTANAEMILSALAKFNKVPVAWDYQVPQ